MTSEKSDSAPRPESDPSRARRWVRLLGRVIAGAVGGLVVVLLLVIGLLSFVQPAREAVLGRLLDTVREGLPGELRFTVHWPALGRWELRDLLWTADVDTLASLGAANLDLDVGALLSRRLVVHELRVENGEADLDAIAAAFGPSTPDSGRAADASGDDASMVVPWFGPGRLPALPDAVIEDLVLRDLRASAGGRTYALDRADVGLDLREEPDVPWLRLDLHARAVDLATIAWSARAVRTDSLALEIAPLRVGRTLAAPSDSVGTGVEENGAARETTPGTLVAANDLMARLLAGEALAVRWSGPLLAGELGDLRSNGSLRSTSLDADVDLALPRETVLLERALAFAGADTVAIVQRLLATWPQDDPYAVRARFTGDFSVFDASVDFVLPGPTAVVDPAALPLALDDDVARTYLRVRGSGSTSRSAEGTLAASLDLGGTAWLQSGRVVAQWDGATARIDTLRLVREGLRLQTTGSASAERVDLALDFDVDSDGLGGAGLTMAGADSLLHFRARGTAHAHGALPLPDFELDFDASARGAFGEVPSVRVRAEKDSIATRLKLALDEPATLAGERVELARVRWEGTVRTDPLQVEGRASTAVDVRDVRLDVASAIEVSAARGVRAEVDTLDLDAVGAIWRSQRRFTVERDSVGRTAVSGLDLRGDLGTLRADAVLGSDSLDVRLDTRLVLTRDVLVALLPDSLHASIPADSTRIEAEVRVVGPLRAPSGSIAADLRLEGARRLGPLAARADVWLRADGALALSGAPDDLAERGVAVELAVEHDGAPWIEASGRLTGDLDLQSGRFVRAATDTARVELRANEVDLSELAALAGERTPIRGVLDASVRGNVFAREGDADVTVDVRELALQRVDGSWWQSDVAVRARGRGDLDGDVVVDTLRVDLGPGRLAGSGRMAEGEISARVDGTARLPRDFLEAVASNLQTGYELPADTLQVAFTVRAEGPVDGPSAYAELDWQLRASEELPPYDLHAEVWLRGDPALATSGSVVAPWPGSPPDELPARGVLGRLEITESDAVSIEAYAQVPLRLGLRPVVVQRIEGEPLSLLLDTGRLRVARLATLADLDGHGDFSGDVSLRLSVASDDGETISLDGALRSETLRADLLDGSWVRANADVAFGGTTAAPTVDGGVNVEGGVLRIPEAPPALHEKQGTALLWDRRRVGAPEGTIATEADSTAAAAVDSTRNAAADTTTARPEDPPDGMGLVPKLDVTLAIPGNLRLVGMGLDIELNGSLTARNDGDEIGVVGSLEATRGSYQFLGRRFTVRTGRVTFYGDLDPELDLRLATTLQSTTYFVQIRGTARSPRFELSSDPQMSEGDIVSALLFGRPLDQLDEGQSQLLRQRTQEVATQLGASLLAQRVGQQIGVDILSVQQSSEGEGQALVVGKYLSPDVLVQYEQVLDESAAALVRLEYALSRFFKIETTASQGDHSGIELKWSRDY